MLSRKTFIKRRADNIFANTQMSRSHLNLISLKPFCAMTLTSNSTKKDLLNETKYKITQEFMLVR